MSHLHTIVPFGFGETTQNSFDCDKEDSDLLVMQYLGHRLQSLLADCLRTTEEDKEKIDSLSEEQAMELGEWLNGHKAGLQNFGLGYALTQENVLSPMRSELPAPEIEEILSKHRFQNAKSAEAYYAIQLARTALERGGVENLMDSYDNYFHKGLGALGHMFSE